MEAPLLAAGLCFARLLPVCLAVPYLGGRLAPALWRASLAVLLVTAMVPTWWHAELSDVDGWSPILYTLALVREGVLGLAIALVAGLVFWALELAIAAIASQLEPLSGFRLGAASRTALGHWVTLLVTAIFVTLGGHRVALRGLAELFERAPLGAIEGGLAGASASLWSWVLFWLSQLFTLGLVLALPVVTVLLVTDFTVGLLSRSVPGLHQALMAVPLKSLLAILLVALLLDQVVAVVLTEAGTSAGWVRWLENLFGPAP